MDWRVGVLRSGAENVEWTHKGLEPDWPAARAAAIDSLRELASVSGRQEYRLQVGDVDGIVRPGVDESGRVEFEELGESLPPEWPLPDRGDHQAAT